MSSSLSLAPHLQRALEAMSKDMAVDPQALVNQAVFAWLRTNGYAPGTQSVSEAPAVVPAAPVEPMPAIATPVPMAEPVTAPPPVAAPAVVPALDLGPSLERMAEIDADLERLAKPWPAWSPVQEEEEEDEKQEDELPVDEAPPEPEPEPEPLVTSREPTEDPVDHEEPGLDGNTGEVEVEEEDVGESTIVLRSVPISLYLEREGTEPIKVTSDRFIIGRGPHCDLVIDSPRVSREHVALTRKGVLFFLEDLNSSNGTWLGEERVTTRELESGDVINLGNEPVTFVLRGE